MTRLGDLLGGGEERAFSRSFWPPRTVAVVEVDPLPTRGLGEGHGGLLGGEAVEPALHEEPPDGVVRRHAGVTEAQSYDLDPNLF